MFFFLDQQHSLFHRGDEEKSSTGCGVNKNQYCCGYNDFKLLLWPPPTKYVVTPTLNNICNIKGIWGGGVVSVLTF